VAAAVVTRATTRLKSWLRDRWGDLAVLAVFVGSLIVMGVYVHHQTSQLSERNCRAIENLKGGQRDAAQATIDGDNAFLKVHPDGTADFPEAVVRADIAAKQSIVDRYPPKPCPKP
jgi:hypothetical protein